MDNKKKISLIPWAPGKSWEAMLALWLVFALNSTVRELFNRTQVLIADDLGIDSVTVGAISSEIAIAMGIAPLFWGQWSDKRGLGWKRKYSLIVIGMGYLILTILTGLLAASAITLAVLMVIRNLFAGGGEACECSTIVEWWPMEARGFAAGLHHTGYPWGTFLTGLLISAMIAWTSGNWNLIFILIPLMGIPIWLFYWKMSSKKNYEEFEEKTRAKGFTPPMDFMGEEATKGGLVKCLKNTNVMVTSFAIVMTLFVFIGLNYWLNPYLVKVGGMDYSSAAIFSIIYSITGGLGQIVWGRLSDIFGRKPCMLFCFAWLAVCACLLPKTAEGMGWCCGVQLALGFCMNAQFATGYALIQDSAPKGCIGSAMSLAMAASALGGFSPVVLGAFINMGGGWNSVTGYYTGAYVMAGAMVVAFLLVFLFTHETVGKKRGRDWALVSYRSAGIEVESDKQK